MKYSAKFTLNIPMKEFYEFAIPLVSKKELHKAIKSELYMCWSGITNGEWGGNACDWKQLFYQNLHKDGFIKQTDKSIDFYSQF